MPEHMLIKLGPLSVTIRKHVRIVEEYILLTNIMQHDT